MKVKQLTAYARPALGLAVLVGIAIFIPQQVMPQQTHAPTFTTIDFPGAYWSEAWGINNKNDFCGMYVAAPGGQWRGWTKINGVFASFNVPGARATTCFGINDNGWITGNYWDANGGHGYRYDGTTIITIDVPNAILTATHAIDNLGNLTGWFQRPGPEHLFSAMYWKEGVLKTWHYPGTKETRPHGMDDKGNLAGWFVDLNGKYHGYTSKGQTLTGTYDVPGALQTLVMEMNNLGRLVGWYQDASRHAFVYQNGVYTTVDYPGSNYTNGHSINDRNRIAGMYIDAAGIGHGFSWAPY